MISGCVDTRDRPGLIGPVKLLVSPAEPHQTTRARYCGAHIKDRAEQDEETAQQAPSAARAAWKAAGQ